jgi:hypothetical protein
MATGAWQPGPFRQFTIIDPKLRTISAAPFADRVAHHAIMNVLDPIFDCRLIDTSYACRRGTGTQAAVLRAFAYGKQYPWFAKMDIRKYFDSINQGILKTLLRRILKDPGVLHLLDRIIDSYQTSPGKGLPIGNLTSQYFANHYLSGLDHQIKTVWHQAAYVRYMDDMILWDEDRPAVADRAAQIASWLWENRALETKPAVIAGMANGLPFLGYHLMPGGIYLSGKARRRFRAKYRRIDHQVRNESMPEAEAARRLGALVSMTLLARARHFRNTVCGGQPRARTASNGAGTGTTALTTHVCPIATTTRLTTGTTT